MNGCINKILKKFQSIYFKGYMFVKGIMGLPAQTGKEIRILKAMYSNFSGKKIEIFEWGSGFSTIYFAEYLRKSGANFEWASIDNNKKWHQIVEVKLKRKGLTPYVRLYLKDFLPFWEKPGWKGENIPPPCGVFGPKSENEKAYINFVTSLNKKFDIIIIDARFRRHCLKTAKDALAPGGVVVMHDAQKAHYHAGMGDFRYKKFFNTGTWVPFQEIPNKVWVGSMENNKIFETLEQF